MKTPDILDASSLEGTKTLVKDLVGIFNKYQIKSIFDAGARNAHWQHQTIAKHVKYSAGDIDLYCVKHAKYIDPDLDIFEFDITKDIFPDVDMLLVRDVTIHLDTTDKQKFFNQWLNSNVPYLLISHAPYEKQNLEIDYNSGIFPFASVNWLLPPWNWPSPIDSIPDCGRTLSLWHQTQFK